MCPWPWPRALYPRLHLWPLPPVAVITRRATWLRAALYYSENFSAVPTIVNNWTGEGILVSQAKEVINVDGLGPDLARINQYRTLATNVDLLEASTAQ